MIKSFIIQVSSDPTNVLELESMEQKIIKQSKYNINILSVFGI